MELKRRGTVQRCCAPGHRKLFFVVHVRQEVHSKKRENEHGSRRVDMDVIEWM